MLSRCTSLDLSDNEMKDAGLAAILRSPHLQNLQVLKVSHNHITDSGIEKLRECWPRVFGKLISFDLSENMLTSYGYRLLEDVNAKNGGTVSLDLSGNLQATVVGLNPIPNGEMVQGAQQGVSDIEDAAELRRRVAHPAMRAGDRPNPHG
jgi:hypothetical protein